ncbi:MAG TPA: substrate-binding domain-containing protein [Prolixibacteraceae bacterium]|nr:substrate-binding domain-containing protein [Prolixibacteraceae bacterium]
MMTTTSKLFRCWLLVFIFLVSCQHERKDTPTDGTTFIAVDETFAPIIQQEIDVFESIYQSTGIIDRVCPEVDAFNLMLKDSVRMIVATRKLTEKEIRYFNDQKIFPQSIKIAIDGIAFIVHPTNQDTLLTTETIRDIMLGKIFSWDQVNLASKLGPIKMIFDNPKSSTAEYAVKSICAEEKLSPSLTALNSNPEVIDYVSKTPGAIGIIGVSWVSDRRSSSSKGLPGKVKVVAISREKQATPENSYQPYQACLADGRYPYTRDVYVIMTEPRISLNTGFSSFIVSDRGQRIILKSGLLPAIQPPREIHVKDGF